MLYGYKMGSGMDRKYPTYIINYVYRLVQVTLHSNYILMRVYTHVIVEHLR